MLTQDLHSVAAFHHILRVLSDPFPEAFKVVLEAGAYLHSLQPDLPLVEQALFGALAQPEGSDDVQRQNGGLPGRWEAGRLQPGHPQSAQMGRPGSNMPPFLPNQPAQLAARVPNPPNEEGLVPTGRKMAESKAPIQLKGESQMAAPVFSLAAAGKRSAEAVEGTKAEDIERTRRLFKPLAAENEPLLPHSDRTDIDHQVMAAQLTDTPVAGITSKDAGLPPRQARDAPSEAIRLMGRLTEQIMTANKPDGGKIASAFLPGNQSPMKVIPHAGDALISPDLGRDFQAIGSPNPSQEAAQTLPGSPEAVPLTLKDLAAHFGAQGIGQGGAPASSAAQQASPPPGNRYPGAAVGIDLTIPEPAGLPVAEQLADLVNQALMEQARRQGVDIS